MTSQPWLRSSCSSCGSCGSCGVVPSCRRHRGVPGSATVSHKPLRGISRQDKPEIVQRCTYFNLRTNGHHPRGGGAKAADVSPFHLHLPFLFLFPTDTRLCFPPALPTNPLKRVKTTSEWRNTKGATAPRVSASSSLPNTTESARGPDQTLPAGFRRALKTIPDMLLVALDVGNSCSVYF